MTVKAKTYFYLSINPKRKGFKSGYISQFQIRNDMQNDGRIEFTDKNFVTPGETVNTTITFIRPDLVRDYLSVGKKYAFGEGIYSTGEITVLEIID